MTRTIVVIGHGMVGHRFLEEAVARGLHETHRIVVLSEERRAAYDRVHLSSFFTGAGEADRVFTVPKRLINLSGSIFMHRLDPAVAGDAALEWGSGSRRRRGKDTARE